MSNYAVVFMKQTPSGRVKHCYTVGARDGEPVKKLKLRGWKEIGSFHTSRGYNSVTGTFPTVRDVLSKNTKGKK